ncbi:hypothetical protein ACFTSF_07835 [Kribbella sp. NPDC056951]|uniref:hypothetical protein n=1 Tax=Kribbella sp. NPDC056951 TaxID=3345978 RepID=UPI00363106B7
MLKNRVLLSSALLVLGLILLAVGGFIQFHDVSGFGWEQWNRPLGYVAAVLGIAAVVAAWPLPKARTMLGIELAVLSGLVILLGLANTGFRFIWVREEFEMVAFEFILFLLAIVLVATARAARTGAGGWLRLVGYLLGTTVLVYGTFLVGVEYYDRTMCGSDDSGDCLAVLGALFWAGGAIVVCVIAIAVIEGVLWRRRHPSRVPQHR